MTDLVFTHDEHFDLVHEKDMGRAKSLGEYPVESRDGTEMRHKVRRKAAGNLTTSQLPDDAGSVFSPQDIVNLIGAWNDRHADAVTGVWCEDAALGRRFAAMMDVPYLNERPEVAGAVDTAQEVSA